MQRGRPALTRSKLARHRYVDYVEAIFPLGSEGLQILQRLRAPFVKRQASLSPGETLVPLHCYIVIIYPG
jgi:hypothetical protein